MSVYPDRAAQLADLLPAEELETLERLHVEKAFRLVGSDEGVAVCRPSPLSEPSAEQLVTTLLALARVGHATCVAARDAAMSPAGRLVRDGLRGSAFVRGAGR